MSVPIRRLDAINVENQSRSSQNAAVMECSVWIRDPEDHDCPIHTSERTHASPPPHLARSQKSWSGRRRSRNRTKPAAAIGAGIAVLVLTVLLAFPTVLPESPTSLVPGVEDIEEGTAEILETISENLEIEHQLEQAKDGEHTTAQIPDLTDTADNNPAKWKAYMNSVS